MQDAQTNSIADFLLAEMRADWEQEIFANQNCRIALIRRDRLGEDHTDKSPVRA